MPQDDMKTIESGRNDKGQFASKQEVSAAALRQIRLVQQENLKAKALVDKLTAATAKQAATVTKLWKAQQKQSKDYLKGLIKGQKEQTKTQKQMTRFMSQTQKLVKKSLRGAGGGGGGGGFLGLFGGGKGGLGLTGGLTGGMGGILGGLSIYAAYHKLMSASTPFMSAEIGQRGSSAAIRNALQPKGL